MYHEFFKVYYTDFTFFKSCSFVGKLVKKIKLFCKVVDKGKKKEQEEGYLDTG